MHLSDFDYQLDKDLIALQPLEKRDTARMLVQSGESIYDDVVSNLTKHLRPGDLIVFNDTKVIAAKLDVEKGGKKIQIYLNEQIDDRFWYAFAKPTKKLDVGDSFVVSDGLAIAIVEKGCDGNRIKIQVDYEGGDFFAVLEKYGDAPLPPYIEKMHEATKKDKNSYQSVFAKHWGSVAAPTASLHFTDKLLDSIKNAGINTTFVTLHVGSGTFLPITSNDIDKHKMHSEFCRVSQDAADLINKTKRGGGKILAVGSTALRTLEAVANNSGEVKQFSGSTDIFIKPGYKFKIVDLMLTNFHLPKSTLLVLVASFIGHKNMKKIYKHAIEKRYRFFSYGDSCLLKRLCDV